MEPFLELISALNAARVRFLLIGVAGANYYAPNDSARFLTLDRDLFLPREPDNLVIAWEVCERLDFELLSSDEPLDRPRDRWLAERVTALRALTKARRDDCPEIDLTLTMAGFEFDAAWLERRTFSDDGVDVPVARLVHIAASKAAAGRPKDQAFLRAHGGQVAEWKEPPKHSSS
jgi:hypothetical protein